MLSYAQPNDPVHVDDMQMSFALPWVSLVSISWNFQGKWLPSSSGSFAYWLDFKGRLVHL